MKPENKNQKFPLPLFLKQLCCQILKAGLLGLLTILLTATPGYTYPLPLKARSITMYNRQVGETIFNTKTIARFVSTYQGKTALERAQELADNIKQMAALGLDTKSVSLNIENTDLQALVAKKTIFSLTAAEVSVNQTAAPQLAKEWLGNIQKIFDAIPGYYVRDFSYQDPNLKLPHYGFAQSSSLLTEKSYTAAHRYFPKGTKIRIVNPEKTWSVVVTIGTRLPLPEGVTICIDKLAAQAVGLDNQQQPGRVWMEKVN